MGTGDMGTERDMGRNTFGPTRIRGSHGGPYGARTGLRNLALTLAFVAAGSALAAQPVVIAALGDSLTAGYGLPEEEGFAPQLQAWLRANGAPEVTVVNAGVSGDTSAGGLARADWRD
jgi:acyl-CoA thioesterase-1